MLAVIIWAEFFAPRNERIDALRPFVSKDADIVGTRYSAQRLADLSGWEITFFHQPRTIASAVLTKRRPGAETLTVEVLRVVLGLTQQELEDADVVELRPGQIYRIPSPIRLLKAKLANVRQIKPTRPHDLHHVNLLILIAQEYLRDQHAQVAQKHVLERALVNAMHELHDLVAAKESRAIAAKHGTELAAALPLDLAVDGMPKLAAFYLHVAGLKNEQEGT